MMELTYISPFQREPGCIARILEDCYGELLRDDPILWGPERENWYRTDKDVFANPDTIGACSFLTCFANEVIGFFSFDPRKRPEYGVIGHNCIVPSFRRNGVGKTQILQILQSFTERGIHEARVSTCDHPFFIPAQRMYLSCGFQEITRSSPQDGRQPDLIHYRKKIHI